MRYSILRRRTKRKRYDRCESLQFRILSEVPEHKSSASSWCSLRDKGKQGKKGVRLHEAQVQSQHVTNDLAL